MAVEVCEDFCRFFSCTHRKFNFYCYFCVIFENLESMNNDNIKCLNEYVQTVSHASSYWMVRTMGGVYYNDFIDNGFIAIGHNDILLKDIKDSLKSGKNAQNKLRGKVAALHPEIERPGHVASQLIRFCQDLKIGDIVLVPGRNSFRLSICRVKSAVYEDVNIVDENDKCPFFKRIDVQILKSTSRTALPPKAQLMFNSRHPISDISEYATYIDSTQFDFYNKDEETHIVFRIKTEKEVDVSTFYEIQQLFVLAEQFCKENDIDGCAKDVAMKVQMESPGWLHFISKKTGLLSALGLLVLFINGGGLEINDKDFHLGLKTDGLIKNASEFLDRKTDREMRNKIKDSLDSLQINTPEDFRKAMIELYKTQNANRKEY